MDTYSKWAEVVEMAHTTTAKTIVALRNLFATHGIPEQIVSNDKPQSSDFEAFTRRKESSIHDHHLTIQIQMTEQNGLSGHSRRALRLLRMMALL